MKVKDIIKKCLDIDVYDEMDCIGLPMTAPIRLTPEGKKYFKKVLNFKIHIEPENGIARLKTKSPFERSRILKQERAIEFFNTAAGYGNKADYDRWFAT